MEETVMALAGSGRDSAWGIRAATEPKSSDASRSNGPAYQDSMPRTCRTDYPAGIVRTADFGEPPVVSVMVTGVATPTGVAEIENQPLPSPAAAVMLGGTDRMGLELLIEMVLPPAGAGLVR